jgi:hypothetical protein
MVTNSDVQDTELRKTPISPIGRELLMAVPVPPVDTGHANGEPRRRYSRHHQRCDAVAPQLTVLTGRPPPDDGHTCGHAS